MISAASPDPLHYSLLALAGLLSVLWFRERLRAAGLRRTLSDLDEELRKLKDAPRQLEYRIERFDVLWYPVVIVSESSKEVLRVLPGTPHCKKCVIPLSSSNGRKGWSCLQCQAAFPESLADVVVADTVSRMALDHFHERHSGYKLPAIK